ncbi:hypothetical protein IHQ56_04760 [Methylobacillus flagellatus]|uniref:hypothetical protein n=1 Tax=Methylobacillus flagellatus TaxID=405 RepID=UPI002853E451|nr:hypothetical protein [Methylobacillus flagellatus]MDR5171124.1 hypothetical protein [Methylobacillus flagellatus]
MTTRATTASWPALLLAPLVVLGHLSVIYALTTPACKQQAGWMLHAVSAASLFATMALTWLALRAWRQVKAKDKGDPAGRRQSSRVESRQAFVAWIALLSGILFSIVTAMLWLTAWLISPCYQ